MEIHSHTTESVAIVEPSGRLDSYTVSALKDRFSEVITTEPVYVIIDLSDVSFMDSSALAVIIQGMRSCRAVEGDLCLANPNSAVRRIIELTRLDKAIDVFTSKDEALDSYRN